MTDDIVKREEKLSWARSLFKAGLAAAKEYALLVFINTRPARKMAAYLPLLRTDSATRLPTVSVGLTRW
jgi:hypothetical protein